MNGLRDFIKKTFLIILAINANLTIGVSHNLRQINPDDGLASSAVTSIHQSDEGIFWIGTLDGVNMYYGDQVIRPSMQEYGALEGYIIERIVETTGNDMWIQTAYGLYKLERLTKKTVCFPQFSGLYKTRVVGDNRVIVIDKDKNFFLYNPLSSSFDPISHPLKDGELIVEMGGTDEYYWFASNTGVYRYDWSHGFDGKIDLEQVVHVLDIPVKYCTIADESEIVYIVDMQNCLYRLDLRQNKKVFVMALGDELQERGMFSDIVECNGCYFVSFKVGGVLKYEFNLQERCWKSEDLGIKSGVFDMCKDKYQNLIWIATDGQGLFACWEGAYNIHSYKFSDFNYKIRKPIRALFLDDKDWLWIGTKGDGLLGIDRSNKEREIYDCSQRLLTSSNSSLEDNSVYALSPSSYNGFWVGTEKGLNFYRYDIGSMQKVRGSQDIEYVHSIQEVGDSLLWIATVGKGIFKANINRVNNEMYLSNVRQFEIEDGEHSSNYFFAMHYSPAGDLWLGNRGYGVFKMSPSGMEAVAWPSKQRSRLQDDVFALYEHKDVLWIGTAIGLIGLDKEGQERFVDVNDGLPNNISHSLQADGGGNLWISTNNGVVCLNPESDDIKVYNRKDGLRVTEFSDGASLYMKDVVYFGGVDGWIEIVRNGDLKNNDEYVAPLYFYNLKGGENKEISLLLLHLNNEDKKNLPTIELERDENFFSVSYMAMDYVNTGNYRYFYKIEHDGNGTWIDNGHLRSVSLAQILPGNYKLSIKYRNEATGIESNPISVKIHIKYYWWQTPFMRMLYWTIFGVSVIYISVNQYRKTKRRHTYALQAMQQRHKEELYEEKLRFFTNVTHEFSTPLTLIYSPCERILAHPGIDDFVRKYVMLIKKQTERLHSLIQEIIDYRRIETKHQKLNLEYYNLSDYVDEACLIFDDVADKNGINIYRDIEPNLYWNMDKRCFPKILTNLLSNAMKYTFRGGTVKVSMHKISEKELQLKVYNTGKGIKEEDKIRIFNRYSVLDEVEENSSNLVSRNGLGMAICHSSVLLLGGRIDINSRLGEYAEFVVTLPLLPLGDQGCEEKVKDVVPLIEQNREMDNSVIPDLLVENGVSDSNKYIKMSMEHSPVILIIDDNKDILYLLHETLSHSYQVKTALNAEEALEHLKEEVPDLIITDVMMPGTDGMALTRQVKHNKHTMHIPLIILSAHSTNEAMTDGLQAGADAYIGKPFNMQYLQAVVHRLIESHKNMREYYNTSASAYSFLDGKLMKSEDKEFVYKLNEIIEQNLYDNSLTTEVLASALNMSSRSLYRRLKELELPFPKDYVKERKMEKAVKLLQTSDKSIQEIIYECGFNNRAHFYKEFGKRFNMTPKEFRNINKHPDDSLDV